ncbi:cell division FtsA domain-containing protein [Patescibacteria group bacterium]|nr:cell division FtsA domain-containing protein [Patescibacteria group bacterium]
MPKNKKQTTTQTRKVQIGRGLDVGTAFIYCARKESSQVAFRTQRNAFFDIDYSEFTRGILEKSDVKYILSKDKIYVVGDDAIKFANVFGKNTRRPLKDGVISPEEKEALPMVELIIKSVLGSPSEKNEVCYYSVPGTPADADFDTIYHQNIIKGFLERRGYRAKPLNEGLAVIFSELAEEDFTGMGISLGGGMANVCLAVMSVPVFSFSVARAGDWIDEQVARVTNEPVSKITTFKETSLDLKKPEISMTKIEQALSIYYNYLTEYILAEIKKEIDRSNRIPEFEKPIPIVIAGGTASPPGFLQRFKGILGKTTFPFEIREVKLAPHPLYTVAKGTLIAAIANKKSQ